MQIERNARLLEQGQLLMGILSETGAKGMSPKGLVKLARMFADNKVASETWFLQAMNERRMRPNALRAKEPKDQR